MAPGGARVTFAALMDHRGIVYRATETRDELADAVLVWDALPVPAGLNCRPNQNWSGTLQDRGPGEQQDALRQWFLVAGFDIQERDVLSVVDGPEAPVLLRILSVDHPTAGIVLHHIEVNVEVWAGSVTEEAVGSS
jgi:hypothetical protein